MSKIIKVDLTTELAVPDLAEIVRITDTDGVEADYIRVDGKLVFPEVATRHFEHLAASNGH